MPELPELMIMSDFINQFSDYYTSISFSEETKNKLELQNLPKKFKISSLSKGKEMCIKIDGNNFHKKLFLSMGMSGNFILSSKIERHCHLIFHRNDGNFLCLQDVRRFAKWKWENDWSKNRGPCPVTDYKNFKNNIIDGIKNNSSIFEKNSVAEILMNQKYFNGIGNYLRAEILGLGNICPFENSLNFLKSKENLEYLVELCKKISIKFYICGGAQFKDWENPNGIDKNNFDNLKKFYKKSEYINDKNGRRLWFDSKWKNLVNK